MPSTLHAQFEAEVDAIEQREQRRQRPIAPFVFLEVNGFIYRGNTATGEMWRLEANPADKKAQVWKKVADDGAA